MYAQQSKDWKAKLFKSFLGARKPKGLIVYDANDLLTLTMRISSIDSSFRDLFQCLIIKKEVDTDLYSTI
jgi:hypothetical protein